MVTKLQYSRCIKHVQNKTYASRCKSKSCLNTRNTCMKRLKCQNLHRVNTEMTLLKCPNTCMKRSICRQSFTRWLDPPSCCVRRKCYPPNNAQKLSCTRKHMHIHNYIGWTLVHHMTHTRKHEFLKLED